MLFEEWSIQAHLKIHRPMLFAVFCLAVLTLAIGVTAFAVVTAKDGYEDPFGFHETSPADASSKGAQSTSDSSAPIPPFAATG